MSDDRFDGLFLNVAQQAQGIEPLLDCFFGFLQRKTDFFAGASPELVEEMVLKIVRKQAAKTAQVQKAKQAEREKEEKKRKERLLKKAMEEQAAIDKQKAAAAAAAAATSTAAGKPDEEGVMELNSDGSFDISNAAAAAPEPTKAPVAATASSSSAAEGGEEKAEGDEEDDKTPAPIGNGGATDRYTWTQSLSEVNIVIDLPRGTTTRMLTVEIKNRHLKVQYRNNKPPPGVPPLNIDDDLFNRVIVDDSCWTLEDGHELCINLQKDNKMEWWKCVCKGDPEINTQKVQPENSKLGDLDGETRQTVEKMMFDQRQKAMGKPTSDELNKQEMLDKFMKAHPEMDFSKAKFT